MRELLHAYAPLQDMLGIAGYWLFGVADRSVYLMNGVLAVGFTGIVLWLTRTLRPLVRIVLSATMLSTPIMVNRITEFNPDLYWRLLRGINPPGNGPQIPGRQLGARQRHGARRRFGYSPNRPPRRLLRDCWRSR
jgi:hypothetical protein